MIKSHLLKTLLGEKMILKIHQGGGGAPLNTQLSKTYDFWGKIYNKTQSFQYTYLYVSEHSASFSS